MKHRSLHARGLPLLLAAALLAACSQGTLYSKLDEREANDQVALLRDAGIQARKVARDGAYAVTVPDSDLGRATLILRDQGLPRQAFGNRGSVFKREGFVTTTMQEHQLGIHAIEQQISHALMGLNGVLDARVVLDMPVRNPLLDKVAPPKASVVVKFRQGVDADAMKSNVKRVVVHSVDGLNHDNVSVEHSVADARPLAPIQSAASSNGALSLAAMPWPLALTSGVGLAAIFGALALWWNSRRNAHWTDELAHTAGRDSNRDTATTTMPPQGVSLRARAAGSLGRTTATATHVDVDAGDRPAPRHAPAGDPATVATGASAAGPAMRDRGGGERERSGSTG